ncbi:NADH-quinone oxidoreductase subunit NuoN [Brevibacillus dissolubilis]|uniref:NADH-quinone oxidoreductase subunit NuoN n=1 Tax=Brevibacillus dissolubilis TaxID=1844116 RepID=UPI001117776A|nr:NADH-quinone oxidoreductase subunit NuoN [Brevibacillus dissolubilis]
MNTTIFSYDWSYLLPEFTVLGFATLVSLLDLFLGKRISKTALAWIALLGVVLAGVFVVGNMQALTEPIQYMNDMMRVDDYGNAFKLLFLTGVAFTILISMGYMQQGEVKDTGEYYYLILSGLLGAMVMASSADLITLFVGLELLSLSSYILVGLRKKSLNSNEAAFKYVVSGSLATAFTLFGMSYVYGLTGTTNLYQITERLAEAYSTGFGFMVLLSFVFLIAGLAFKISAAPNHMWAPDVYQGAPTPIASFLTVVSKAAGFALILRVLFTAYRGVMDQQMQASVFEELLWFISIIAAISMIIGNTMAMRQTNIKRMMAYSGIAQAGYLLVPFAAISQFFFQQTVFYLFAYLLASFGAFAIIMVVTQDQKTEDLKAFAGLYHRAPLTAVAMTIFMLSLAGLPVSAGFFGKFFIIWSSILHANYWLAGIMIGTSIISYYYYFGVIRQMYMRTGDTEAKLRLPIGVGVVVLVCSLGTLVFGAVPDWGIQFIQAQLDPNFTFADMFTPGK